MKLSENELKAKIKNMSQVGGGTFQGILKRLCLERFLARLASSDLSDKLIFKGGNLLRYYLAIGRQTTDLDFLITRIQAERSAVQSTFEQICAVDVGDGFVMSFIRLEDLEQGHMAYPGFRAIIQIRLIEGKLSDNLQIDVGVGDVVEPETRRIDLMTYKGKPFYEDAVSLQVYPVESIFAEKLETVLSKGGQNSRVKDFHDLVLLSRQPDLLSKQELAENIKTTFEHRGTPQNFPLQFSEDEYSRLNGYWVAHGATMGKWWTDNKMPEHIKQAVLEINHFLGTVNVPKNEGKADRLPLTT